MSAIEWTCRRADKRARDFFTPFTESIVKRVRSRKWHRNRPIIFCWKKKNYWPPPPWHGSFQIRRFVPWLQVKKKKESTFHLISPQLQCFYPSLLSLFMYWFHWFHWMDAKRTKEGKPPWSADKPVPLGRKWPQPLIESRVFVVSGETANHFFFVDPRGPPRLTWPLAPITSVTVTVQLLPLCYAQLFFSTVETWKKSHKASGFELCHKFLWYFCFFVGDIIVENCVSVALIGGLPCEIRFVKGMCPLY